MAQRNDQIFQLSLSEIAFTIAFILLLLLGYLVFKEESGRLAAEAALKKVQTTEQATTALNTAKSMFKTALEGRGASNPDEVIIKLIAADEVRAERDKLKQQVLDLDTKLTALTELQNQLEKASKSNRPDITKEEILSALALQDEVRKTIEQQRVDNEKPIKQDFTRVTNSTAFKEQRNRESLQLIKQAMTATGELKTQLKKQLNKELESGDEVKTVEEVVSAAKSFRDLNNGSSNPAAIKKENSDLRGQVAFLKNRLDARGGRDFPPCWANENGKVEFLFAVEMKSDSVVVSSAWPEKREVVARALPEVAEILAAPHSNQGFVNSIQGIFNWSKKQDPECRHYIQLKSSISDAVQSDRARLMIERYFYKVESRR